MILLPDDTIRLFVDVNRGVVKHIRNRVYIFINGKLIGSVKNNSIEEVFKCIYNTKDISIKTVSIDEFKDSNNVILGIELK